MAAARLQLVMYFSYFDCFVMSFSCSGLVVATCRLIGEKDSSDETSAESERDYLHKDEVEE